MKDDFRNNVEAEYTEFSNADIHSEAWSVMEADPCVRALRRKYDDLEAASEDWDQEVREAACILHGIMIMQQRRGERRSYELSQIKAGSLLMVIECHRQGNGLRDWREIHRRMKNGGFRVPASPDSLARQYLRWRRSCPWAVRESRKSLDFLAECYAERARRKKNGLLPEGRNST